MITIYKYITIYSFLRYLWRNLRTQVVCGCMLLNKFYLSVQGRLFRMETFCLFSFKGVISNIYLDGQIQTCLSWRPPPPKRSLLILSPWLRYFFESEQKLSTDLSFFREIQA